MENFNELIEELTIDSETSRHAMQLLNIADLQKLIQLIELRRSYKPAFFNSMGSFAATFEPNERAFAATIQGLDPELWVNFVNECRSVVRQQQQQPQQPQRQQQQQLQQPQRQQQQRQQQQQPQQPQPQQQQPQRRMETEPVLGVVPPMPPGISLHDAIMHKNAIIAQKAKMDKARPKGGKKSRSKKRGRKSVHRRKKSSNRCKSRSRQ